MYSLKCEYIHLFVHLFIHSFYNSFVFCVLVSLNSCIWTLMQFTLLLVRDQIVLMHVCRQSAAVHGV